MRVALVTDADVFAGTECHILALAIGLRDEGIGSLVCCPSPSPLATQAIAAGIEVLALQKRGLLDCAAVHLLARLLSDGRADLLHAHNGRTSLAAALAKRWAGTGGCVVTQHFLHPNHTAMRGLRGMVFRLAHRWVNAQVDQFIAISNAVQSEMLVRAETTPNRLTVVPNGVEPVTVHTLRAAADLRSELALSPHDVLVVCAARLEPEKDVRSLITAMARVSADVPNVRCVIAGEGSQAGALKEQIAAHGLAHVVQLLGFREDVLSLMSVCDLFVLPSVAEPFGLVLIEAMALGKPVIATRVGGPLDIIEDERTGLLIPPRAPLALADAIRRLACDASVRELMGKQGRARFGERFTAAQMARSALQVYHRALDTGPAVNHQAISDAAGPA